MKKKVIAMCEQIKLPLLCLLMADCCLFGAGRLVSVGAIGFRMFVLALFMLVSCPSMLEKRKILFQDTSVLLLLVFCGWLVVSTVRGVQNGNRTSLILTDWKGFIYFFALPAILVTLSEHKNIQTLQKVILYACAALSLASVFLLILYLCAPQAYLLAAEWLNVHQASMLSTITQRIPRLFTKSSPYLLCGCVFSVYFQAKEEKLQAHYVMILSLCLFALLLTYTRSIYLGAAASVLGMLCMVFPRMHRKTLCRVLKQIAVSLAGFLCLLAAFRLAGQTSYLKYAFSRVAVTFDLPADEALDEPDASAPSDLTTEQEEQVHYNELTIDSDALRSQTFQELIDNIKESPIIGLGLGAEVAVRSDGLNEYFYLDLMSKTGLIGLFLYLLPIIFMAFELIRKRNRELTCGCWFSVLLGFLVFSFFNPYMNASLGILLYCCCLSVLRCELRQTNETQSL